MLEAVIQENTKAVVALTAALAANGIGKAAMQAAPAAAATKPVAPKPPAAKPAALNADGEHPDYIPLKQPFLDLVKLITRDPAIAVIAPLGALNEVKGGEKQPGQYAELLQKINAAIAKASAAAAPSLV